ncbi:MAG: DUF116 domain-containing protein [Nitrososphaerota archaeon]
MPYDFTFDLTPAAVRGLLSLLGKEPVKRVAASLIPLGLSLSSAMRLIADLAEIEALNAYWRDEFKRSKRRALFLPHCSRRAGCRAELDPKTPSYVCAGCGAECIVMRAAGMASKRGYDVYIVPGGSCIPKIIREGGYDGAVGVACPSELILAAKALMSLKIPGQAVPLLKNGCANTTFSLEDLSSIL